MRQLIYIVLVMFLLSMLGGCIIRNDRHRSRGQSSSARRSDCPPAYHWNGYKCEHNGRGHAKGHRK